MLGHTNMAAAVATITVVAFLEAPRGIAVEATGQLVVVDGVFGAVLRVEPRSGDRAIISR